MKNPTDFDNAQTLAQKLRLFNIPISHFMNDAFEEKGLTPFQYDTIDKSHIPDDKSDFYTVIPQSSEWVYPKYRPNGFTSHHSSSLIDTGDILQRSALICAGFTARCCLMETAIGSFSRAVNPDKHHVIITLDATNLHPDYYQEYKTDFLAQANESTRDRIGFAVVDEITAALIKGLPHPTPSQSSQVRPYTV